MRSASSSTGAASASAIVRGEPIVDKHFIVLFNAGDDVIDFHIPPSSTARSGTSSSTPRASRPTPSRSSPDRRFGCTAKALIVLSEHDLPEPEVDHSVAASLAAPDRIHDAGTVAEGGAGALERCPRVPTSTYRLQIRPAFDLDAAAEVMPAICATSASTGRTSRPCCARPTGSDHGYDVVDPTLVDPARGGREGLDRLRRGRPRGGPRHPDRHRPEPHGHRASRRRTRGGGTC